MRNRILSDTGIKKISMKKSTRVVLGFKQSFPDEITVCGKSIPVVVEDIYDLVEVYYKGEINGQRVYIEIGRNDLKGIGLYVAVFINDDIIASYENLDYYQDKLNQCISILEDRLGA